MQENNMTATDILTIGFSMYYDMLENPEIYISSYMLMDEICNSRKKAENFYANELKNLKKTIDEKSSVVNMLDKLYGDSK